MKKGSKIRLAKSYAEALFEAAASKNATELVFKDMEKLLQIVRSDQEIIKYLSSPLWSVNDKKAALAEVAKKIKLNELSLSCLDVIADNNRFSDLDDILEQFEILYYKKNDILKVDVHTAIELTDKQNKKLKSNLENLLNKKVVIKYEIKPEILGGLLIQFGSRMVDDTVKGKLEHIELLMKGTK